MTAQITTAMPVRMMTTAIRTAIPTMVPTVDMGILTEVVATVADMAVVTEEDMADMGNNTLKYEASFTPFEFSCGRCGKIARLVNGTDLCRECHRGMWDALNPRSGKSASAPTAEARRRRTELHLIRSLPTST